MNGPVLSAATLAAIAVLGPWAFGAVSQTATAVVTSVGLSVACFVLTAGALRGGAALPAMPLWPAAVFGSLVLAQVVPLPSVVHRLLAPGSWAVWRPTEAVAAAVLGDAARPISVDPHSTLRAVALFAALSLLALLAAPALGRRPVATRCLAAVAVGGFALAVYAVFARARFGALLYGSIAVPTVMPFGPFVNKNHFAGWVAMAAVLVAGLALGLADEGRRESRDWTVSRRAGVATLALVASVTMALAVLASLSRGGAFALTAGAACLTGLVLRRRRRPASTVSALALAVVLGGVLIAVAPASTHERLRSLSGASFRLATWRDTLRLIGASPLLGQGLGAFQDAYPRFKTGYGTERVEHAENDFLEIAAETGLVGLATGLAALVLLLHRAVGDDNRARVVRGAARGGLAALVVLAAHSLLDFDLRIPSNAALAALAASFALAGSRVQPLRPLRCAALAAGTLVLLAGLLWLPADAWPQARQEAARATSSRTAVARRLHLQRAEAGLLEFLRARPAHAEAWLMLAGARRAGGDARGGAALARHAVWLDPSRAALREAAAPLSTE